jgi:hypothetical protein
MVELQENDVNLLVEAYKRVSRQGAIPNCIM